MFSKGALLRRDLFVFMFAGIALICLFILSGGFGVVSAGDVIYEKGIYQSEGGVSSEFRPDVTVGQDGNKKVDHIGVHDFAAVSGLRTITVDVDHDFFTVWEGYLSHFQADVPVYYSGNIVGYMTHGYAVSSSGDRVFYIMNFGDTFDSSTLPETGSFYLNFTALSGNWHFGGATTETRFANVADTALGAQLGALGDGELFLYFYDSLSSVIAYDIQYSKGDPSLNYNVLTDFAFWNVVYIYEANDAGVYPLTVQREGFEGYEGTVTSNWKIYDSEYVYLNQSTYPVVNTSIYLMPSVCGNILYFECHDLIDSNDGYFWSASGFCEVPELGYFDLSGYTRSVYGNLIPGVLLTAQGGAEYSNNISLYEFEGLETGSFDLAWNKTGYHNDSVSMYIGIPGDYERDVYLTPLDALDAGEFGGVVYDFCTHKSIQGVYVYLFNETADSGKYAYSNKYGFYRFAGMSEGLDYEVSASKDGYDASIIHSFTFNESNVNETHRKTKNIWLLPEGGCPEDGGIPTPPPAPTPTPHEWTNEEIVSWLRVNLMGIFIIVLLFTFLWFIRKAGGSRR